MWGRSVIFLRFSVQLVLVLGVLLGTAIGVQADALLVEELNRNVIDLYGAGKYGEAIPFAEEAVAMLRTRSHASRIALAASLSWLAALHVAQSDYAKAVPLYDEVLRIVQQALGHLNPALGVGLDTLGLALRKQEKLDEAQSRFRQAIEIKENALARNLTQPLEGRQILDALIEAQNSMIRPKHHVISGYEWEEELLADRATEVDLAASLNNMAASMPGSDMTEARMLSLRALNVAEKQLGQKESLDRIPYLNNLALLHCIPDEEADFPKCEGLLREAFNLQQKILGPWNLEVAQSYERLAYCFLQQHRTPDVVSMYNSALAIHEKVLGAETPAFANSLVAVAEHFKSISNWGRNLPVYAEAESLMKRAVSIQVKIPGADAEVAGTYYKLGMNAFQWGHFPEAEAYFGRALVIREDLVGMEHLDLVDPLVYIAWSLKAQGAV